MREYRLYDLFMLSPWMDKTKLQWDKSQKSKGCLWQGGNWLERVKKEVSWSDGNNFYIVLINIYVCEYNWQNTSSWILKTCTWCYIDYTSKVSKMIKSRILEKQMMQTEKIVGENQQKEKMKGNWSHWRSWSYYWWKSMWKDEEICSYLIFSWVFTMYQALC